MSSEEALSKNYGLNTAPTKMALKGLIKLCETFIGQNLNEGASGITRWYPELTILGQQEHWLDRLNK